MHYTKYIDNLYSADILFFTFQIRLIFVVVVVLLYVYYLQLFKSFDQCPVLYINDGGFAIFYNYPAKDCMPNPDGKALDQPTCLHSLI